MARELGTRAARRGASKRAGALRHRPSRSQRSWRGSGRLLERGLVDLRERDLVELLVGRLLLLEGLAEQLRGLLVAARLGQRVDRAVARDLVVLDLLRRGDQRRIEDLRTS